MITMPGFEFRSNKPELMDQPGIPESETKQALQELEAVNKFLGGYSVVLNALERISWPNKTVKIIDLGCGGGDMLRMIAEWANQKNRKVDLLGIDRNPVMVEFASSKSTAWSNIKFMEADVFEDKLLLENADISMNSLFCHHFDNEQLVELIKRMYKMSSVAVIINDLHRHWFAFYSIKIITSLFSKTYLVKYDAPLSVARSLKRKEWKNILVLTDIKNYEIRWKWAWRWQIIIPKK